MFCASLYFLCCLLLFLFFARAITAPEPSVEFQRKLPDFERPGYFSRPREAKAILFSFSLLSVWKVSSPNRTPRCYFPGL